MLQELHELYAYNRWANQRILAAASTLSADQLTFDLRSSFPSVLATLGHILSADWIWLERWNGGSPLGFPESWDLSTFASVAERWDEVEQSRSAFLQRLKAEDLLRILHYRNSQGGRSRHLSGS